MGQIRSYLEIMESAFTNTSHGEMYRKLLKHGKEYSVEDVEKFGKTKYDVRQRQCFRNSALLALYERNVSYVQGFYLTSGIPLTMEHAFNLKGARIIDTTAEKFGIPVDEYFGIEIPSDFLRSYFEEHPLKPVDMILNCYLETLE